MSDKNILKGVFLDVGQSFVNASLKSFSAAAGWYIWTWKVEIGFGFEIWSVQLQSEESNGIRLYLK